MKTASRHAMSKNRVRTPQWEGFTLSKFGAVAKAFGVGWGRPERETRTRVNIENRLYGDKGGGGAAGPLPYPLEGGACRIRGCGRGAGELSLSPSEGEGVGEGGPFTRASGPLRPT